MPLGCGSGVTPGELGCPSCPRHMSLHRHLSFWGNRQGADAERLQGPSAFAPGPGAFVAEKSSPLLLPLWPSPLGVRSSWSLPVISEADPPGAQAAPSFRMHCPSEARSGPASSVPRCYLIRIILGQRVVGDESFISEILFSQVFRFCFISMFAVYMSGTSS